MNGRRKLTALWFYVLLSLFAISFLFTRKVESGLADASTTIPASTAFINSLSDQEQAWLRDHPVIRVVQDPGWPPVEFKDERGEPSGMSGDYLRFVEQRIGVKFVRVQNLSWLEAYDRLKRWEIDMTTCVAVTPQRTEFWAFTKPYLEIPIVIATQLDVTYIAGMRELFGKQVAVVENYAIDDWLANDFPEIHRIRVKTTLEGLQKLQRGEVFAYIDNLLIIGDYQAKMKVTNIKIAGQTPYVNAQCMAVRKDWAPLAGILQKALESIPITERNDIYRKWLPVRYEYGFNYTLFWQTLIGFVVILLTLVFWNRKLVKEIRFRKQAEESVRDSEERLNAIIKASPNPVVLYDIEGYPQYLNSAFSDVFGWTLDELRGSQIPFIPEDQKEITTEKINESYKSEKPVKIQTRRLTKAGEIIDVIVCASVIRGAKGKTTGLVVNITDISDYKKLEERLQQAQKLESIGTLAGGIAHDFNNILYPLLGFAELLKEDIPADSPLQAHIDEILNATMRSKNLVQQILAFSRKGDQSAKPIKLQPIVQEALKLLRSSIPTTIDIQQDIDSDCGVIMADATQIHQIVMNLATNAYHAMEDAGGILKVSLKQIEIVPELVSDSTPLVFSTLSPGKYAFLTISDTGIGITKDILDKIFEPYFTTKGIGKGTGLGLSVVHGIVKAHEGEIWISSVPGKGTEVQVYLPIMEQTVEEKQIESSEPLLGGTERILLVDDEEAVVRLEKQMLERLGYHVEERTGSIEALNAFAANPDAFELVISDMTMPKMTGIQLAGALILIRPDIPVVICTGFSEKIDEEKANAKGIKGFLMKPVDRSVMAKMVRKVLDEAKM